MGERKFLLKKIELKISEYRSDNPEIEITFQITQRGRTKTHPNYELRDEFPNQSVF